MKAWRVVQPNKIELQELGVQSVEEKCVKLKMLTSSIAASEIALYQSGGNDAASVMGRSGVGLVTETGDAVSKLSRGDFVYIRPASPCGECVYCKSGREAECERRYAYGKNEDGVMRDFIVVPQDDLLKLPSKVAPQQGVFIEDVSMALAAFDKLGTEKGEYVVIMGATKVGLALAQAAIYYQAVPILVDRRSDRLEKAEKMGIYYTVNSADSDPVKKVFAITCGKMAEAMAYCVDCGMPVLPVQRALDCLASNATVAFVCCAGERADLTFDYMRALEKSITVKAVTPADENISSAVNMLVSGAVDVELFVSQTVQFGELGEKMDEIIAHRDESIGVVVEIDKI